MTFTILHNKNCSKSRACIQILENENIDFTIRDYIKNPLSLDEVKHLTQNLLGNKFDILRNKTEKDFDDKDLIKKGLILKELSLFEIIVFIPNK